MNFVIQVELDPIVWCLSDDSVACQVTASLKLKEVEPNELNSKDIIPNR